MHMNIHADIGLVAGNAEHEMRAFGANAMERLQQRWIARQGTAMVGDNPVGNVMNLRRFDFVEGAAGDRRVNRLGGELAHSGWRTGASEQPVRACQGDFVAGSGGDQTRDELLERRVETFFRQSE
jgi:hypothetical protein